MTPTRTHEMWTRALHRNMLRNSSPRERPSAFRAWALITVVLLATFAIGVMVGLGMR